MQENKKFHVDVPSFKSGALGSEVKTSKRGYAHSIDAEIIKLLDNKAINSIFRNLVEILADSTYGTIVAGSVHINSSTYSDINALVDECVKELEIEKPYVIISPSIQGLNAMAFGSDESPYVAISPLMASTMSKEQLKFIIGHECGHIAMGHMIYHTVISIATNFAGAIPVIGPVIQKVGVLPLMAWSRRSEISADRAGLLCCGNLEIAERTLLQLQMPFLDANKIDIQDYVKNYENYISEGTVRKLGEFANAHPIIPKRIQAMQEFTNSTKYYSAIGKPYPTNAISDDELENRVEDIIKVL